MPANQFGFSEQSAELTKRSLVFPRAMDMIITGHTQYKEHTSK